MAYLEALSRNWLVKTENHDKNRNVDGSSDGIILYKGFFKASS